VKYCGWTAQFRKSTASVARALSPAKLFVLATVALGASCLQSQTSTKPARSPSSYPAVKSIRMIQAKDGPAVEILSTRPLVPAVQTIENPWRLVIDLPHARLDVRQKRIAVEANQIKTLRADQFQENPPVARIVLDLLAPRSSTWEAAGNRLVVHLGKNPPAEAGAPAADPPTGVVLTRAPAPLATALLHSGALVTLSGEGIVSGSSFTAGESTAVLKLTRGGQVEVCPGTTLSVTPSESKHNVMLAMNTGAMEAHYYLDASSDSIVTPDFRILLTGPGEFHYAISADTRGNTCVRALPGNTAAAIVSELMGDGTYQVKATDQLMFHGGRLDQVDMSVPLECGCPPRQPILRAALDPPKVVDAPASRPQNLGTKLSQLTSLDKPAAAASQAELAGSESDPKAIHLQVEAPLVFRAADLPPAPISEMHGLPAESRQLATPAITDPLPPMPPQTPQSAAAPPAKTDPAPRRGFFGKVRGFFSAMFR
jgi:hypothetical protein